MKESQLSLEQLNIGHRNRRVWLRILTVLICMTVFVTTYALVMPAATMNMDEAAICGFISHRHTDKCYQDGELICELPEHEHDMACFKKKPIISPYHCGYDYEHTHTEECFADGVLLCSYTEHTHSDACLSVAEQLRISVREEGTRILSEADRTDMKDLARATGEINALYDTLDEAYYEDAAISESDHAALCQYVSQFIYEINGLKKSLRPMMLGAASTLTPTDPVDFAGTYDTAVNRKNDWQIVSGREGVVGYKTITNSDNVPILRLKKSVLPAGKEDEFYVSLVVEPVFVRNWDRLFGEADLVINNSHNTQSFTTFFHKYDPVTGELISLSDTKKYGLNNISNHCSYIMPADHTFIDTVTADQVGTGKNYSKNVHPVKKIVIHVSTTDVREFTVDVQFNLSTISGLSFYYSTETMTYKSDQVNYNESTSTLDIPEETYANMLLHGFDFLKYMDPFSTVSFNNGGTSTGTMMDGTTVKTITDFLGDHIELLEVNSFSGDPTKSNIVEIDEDNNAINWSLADAEPYRIDPVRDGVQATWPAGYKPTAEDYGYSLVGQGTDASGNDIEYFARINAYQMIYKVKLKNEDAGFVSSVSGSALPAAGSTAADAQYQTNDRGANQTSIEYMLVGDSTVHEEYFPSPVVRGALYKVELLKTDESDHPLSGAKFRLTTADNTPVYVTGSAGSYQFAPDGGDVNLVESGSDGYINVTGLPDGSYLLTEVEPPLGYETSGTSTASYLLCYTDNAAALTADGSAFKLTSTPQVENKEKPKYTLTLHKQDDEAQPLENVHFAVYNGTTFVCEMVTDASGNAALPAGTSLYGDVVYSLHGTVIPDGYYAPTDDLTFSVAEATGALSYNTGDTAAWITCTYDSANKVLAVTAVNTPGEELPSTGGRGMAPFMITGFCLMALPILYYGISLKKERKKKVKSYIRCP